jgi:hypothetical protein
MSLTKTLYPLLDTAREALSQRNGPTAHRFLSIVLRQYPDHVQARHLAALATYYQIFNQDQAALLDTQHDITQSSGNFHLDVALILEKGGYSDATLVAFKTAALLNYTLNPAMRATLGAFNGQILRMQIFQDLAKSNLLGEVLETGTHWGTTTEYMAWRVPCPVRTTEISPYFIEASRLRFAELDELGSGWRGNVELFTLDSRAFLEAVLRNDVPEGGFSFGYLDAHCEYLGETEVENPLLGEIALIRAARRHCILMIDDFKIPDDPDYGFEEDITLDSLHHLLAGFDATFFPLSSRHDSGFRRGFLILSGSPETTALLDQIGELRRADH